MDWLTTLVPLALIIVLFYFMLIRPQSKRDKQMKAMRENLQVGDEVTTTGGIVGIVIGIKDDTVLIETGGDKNKIRVKKWAISTVETIHE